MSVLKSFAEGIVVKRLCPRCNNDTFFVRDDVEMRMGDGGHLEIIERSNYALYQCTKCKKTSESGEMLALITLDGKEIRTAA